MKRKRLLTVPKSSQEWEDLTGEDETKNAYDGEWWQDFQREQHIPRPLPSSQVLASSSTAAAATITTTTSRIPLLQNFFVAVGFQGTTSNEGEGEGGDNAEDEEGRFYNNGIHPDTLDIGTLYMRLYDSWNKF